MVKKFYDERIPLYLWGRPSTGKTTIIREFAKQMAEELKLKYSEDEYGDDIFTMKVIPLSQYDAPDLRGLPIANNGMTEFLPTKELPRNGQGIIFFDELNLASDDIRAACYSYILEGRYSNLPPVKDSNGVDKFWRVAASNQEQDHCGVNNTSLALLRRFSHIQVIPNSQEILDYFQEKGIDNRVLSYLASFPSDMFPAKYDEKLLEEKANPFPYSWEITSRLIKDVKDANEVYSYAAACVGTMVASKFKGFIEKIGKISMKELLANPAKYLKELSKSEDAASLTYAIIYEVAEAWKKTDKIKGAVLVEIIDNLSPEMATSLLMMTIKHKSKQIYSVPKFEAVIKKLGLILNEFNKINNN
ncbi:MAG: hypothetical protein ACUVXA_16960 [Candidatus Jordarchaeum sp.]|uniref:hypothetical protein n=1 Tax=Candidatus Jordarchaeum sp. TaxID=2823881 RepID=UPI00404A00F7